MLAKREPGQRHRQDRLEIEQQARGRAGRVAQAEGEEQWRDDSARDDGRREPRQVSARERRDASFASSHAPQREDNR